MFVLKKHVIIVSERVVFMDNRLKELRQEKGLLQKELADILGVHYRTIQNWENGGDIKSDKIKEVADYFGVSMGYLLGYESNDELATHILKSANLKTQDDAMRFAFTEEGDLLDDLTWQERERKQKNIFKEFFKNEFLKEYSKLKGQTDETGKPYDDVYIRQQVRTAMGALDNSLWGLPDSINELLKNWAFLNDEDRKYLYSMIERLSNYNKQK